MHEKPTALSDHLAPETCWLQRPKAQSDQNHQRLKAREMAGEILSNLQKKSWRGALNEQGSNLE